MHASVRRKRRGVSAAFAVLASLLVFVWGDRAHSAAAKVYAFGGKPSTAYDIRKNGVLYLKLASTAKGTLIFASDVMAGTRLDFVPNAAPTPVAPPPSVPSAELDQNYPNPFNPSTRIPFTLAQSGHVLLRVFDVNGAYVATVHDGNLNQGRHSLEWAGRNDNGQPVASGMYLYTLTTNRQTLSRKMVVLK